MSADLAGKRLELLSSAFTNTKKIGVLYNTREPATKRGLAAREEAARRLKVALVSIVAQSPEELDAAFQTAKASMVDGLIVFTHSFAVLNRARILDLAAGHESSPS
jgi:ABC-type uncharacterized transport system substrate-binding protein